MKNNHPGTPDSYKPYQPTRADELAWLALGVVEVDIDSAQGKVTPLYTERIPQAVEQTIQNGDIDSYAQMMGRLSFIMDNDTRGLHPGSDPFNIKDIHDILLANRHAFTAQQKQQFRKVRQAEYDDLTAAHDADLNKLYGGSDNQ